jgi:uridine kinase
MANFMIRFSVKPMQTHVYPEEVELSHLELNQLRQLTLIAVLRDVAERGRNIEGCIKQWFQFVKPNFESYVEPQRKVAGKFQHYT